MLKMPISTSQDVDPLELSPVPVADADADEVENDQQSSKEDTDKGVISMEQNQNILENYEQILFGVFDWWAHILRVH